MSHHHTGVVFSPDADRDFEIRTVLGHATERGSDPGEVLVATSDIAKGDHEGWYAAWHDLGRTSMVRARASDAAGHEVSAADAFLRAAVYLGVAVNALSAPEEDDRLGSTFAEQEEAWGGFVDHSPVPVTAVDIPYEGSTLPGWLFRPREGADGRTLILVNGSDGSRGALWASLGAAAVRRGYAVLLFDGPGQQSQLFTGASTFRPDWDAVLTPVYDAVAGLEGVDASRVAVYGISQGGYWVPRALTTEHRFAAAIADPGVVDVAASWVGHFPPSMMKLLDAGKTERFDEEMRLAMRLSPGTARTWRFRARPYGTTGYADTVRTVQSYRLGDRGGDITTPLLITSPQGEQFWPGQSDELAAQTPDVSHVVRFAAEEGADGHCQPLARTLTAQRLLDWLDERLGG